MSQTDSSSKFETLIAEMDLSIKAGKIAEVSEKLKGLNFTQVPRSARLGLAKLCRRVGLVSHGLRLLQPIIRSEKAQSLIPTESEICEYSVLLSRNGSVVEAMNLLDKVNTKQTPEALLYLGYCHISQWEYSQAVGYLESYLQSPAEEYTKLVARVNLASAYVEIQQLERAESLLVETIDKLQAQGATRLVGNCYEILGQVQMFQNRFDLARQTLSQASGIFNSSQSYDQLLIQKTLSIIQALEDKSIEPLEQFQKEAKRRKHWESVRDVDFFKLKIAFDQTLLDRLFFGSPMKAYQNRILALGTPSSSYRLGPESGLKLDLQTGQLSDANKSNPALKTHQILAALLRDLYAPRNLGSLFAELYPNEYFDINSSPARVKQVLVRTRQWLKENEIPAKIQLTDSAYAFEICGEFAVEIAQGNFNWDVSEIKWQELKSYFQNGHPFAADEACRQLNCSRSTFLRLTEKGLQSGELKKSGVGKATRYCFPAQSEKTNSAA